MVEKIDELKEFLPKILSDSKIIYPVLSKGIHDLDEAECISYFSALKEIILLVLEEDIQKREKLARVKKAKTELKKINQATKKK